MNGRYVRTSKELVAFAYVQEEYKKTGDITKGLMSLFAPIIHEQSGQVFDSIDFAKAVQEKYDIAMRPIIAEGLIPKLVEAELLIKEEKSEYVAVYLCSKGPTRIPSTNEDSVNNLLNDFCEFATQALIRQKLNVPVEDLKVGFIERLKSMQFLQVLDGEQSFKNIPATDGSICVTREESKLVQLSLALDILSAEFITVFAEREPVKFDLIVKIASGALIADVVLTLQNPTTDTDLSELTVVIDGPLLMDILDLNTPEYKNFADDLLDLLKRAKVNLVTFDHIVKEVHGSIYAPLVSYTQGEHAYGPLANRFRLEPNHIAYARAVLDDLQVFIENLDITIVNASDFEGEDYVRYCSEEMEDVLRNCLGPLHEAVERRIRDAASIAGVIRMRKGHSCIASITDSKVVFVTRNVQVAKRSTDCLVSRRDMSSDEVPPCILDRQLAGVLWFSLGGGGEKLTRDKLIANCMDALYPRPNLLSTVRQFLENLDPEKGRVFEALMRDKRAQRCLLHKTFGYTEVVTQDNVEELLDEIKRSTAEEVEHEARQREKILQKEHDEELTRIQIEAGRLRKENTDLEAIVLTALERACKSARSVQRMRKAFVIILYGLLVVLATYFSNKIGGLMAAILFGLIAIMGFWVVPDKLLRKWIDKAWQEKFDNEMMKSNVKDYDKHFQINKESCIAGKKE